MYLAIVSCSMLDFTYVDLKDMMTAWVVSRSDEGLGYRTGAARIAAILLVNMAPQQAFIVMRNLLERHCLRSFFGGDGAKAEVDAYYRFASFSIIPVDCSSRFSRIFDTLLADAMPKMESEAVRLCPRSKHERVISIPFLYRFKRCVPVLLHKLWLVDCSQPASRRSQALYCAQ